MGEILREQYELKMGEILKEQRAVKEPIMNYKWQVIYNGDIAREFPAGEFLAMSRYYQSLKKVKLPTDTVTWRLKEL